MRRYIFLLLAFFLTFSAHSEGLGISTSGMGVSATPSGLSDPKKVDRKVANNSKAVKETSNRNANELGNINESTLKAQQPPAETQVNAQTTGVPNLNTKKGKTAQANVSCKTYEGKVYDQGEAGYNDCIRTIKNDRQSEKVVP